MSRKQALKLKKERVRLDALEGRLERLYRQGDDEGFLELAQGRARDLSPAAAALYGQVADRALRRALAGADLPRVQRLLSRIGRNGRSRPLVALAETVVPLGEGRLDEARARLAAVAAEESGGAPWPTGLAAALAALCAPGALSGAADSGGTAAPEAQAIQRFYRALAAVQEREFRPRPAEAEELRQAAEALRTALPADPAVQRLLEATQERLRLLAELGELEKALLRRKGAGFLPLFLERVKGLSRPLLAALRDGPPAAMLRPLHHALRLRWRDLLALVAEREGAAWAGLHAAWPALAAVDLELVGGPEGPRNRAAVRELLEAKDYPQLARLLASLSGAEKAPGRMTLLWSLELWAWERAADMGGEEDRFLALAEPPEHTALVRVGRMAGDVAGRLPAEQRPEAARFLREQLFDLLDDQFFCNHSLEAAAALLRHLPDDPGLLLVALTAAACAKDGRTQNLFAARIAARGEARTTDRETVLRLVSQIVLEEAEVLARVLPSLRLLLGDEAWPKALEIVLRSVTDFVCSGLGPGYDGADLRRLTRELETYRAALGERPELAALETALDCVRPDGGGAPALRNLLGRTPQLEPALVALRVLAAASSPWAPPAVDKAFEHAREAVISRLDLRWRLWSPVLPGLLIGASRSQVRLLRDRIGRLLLSEGLEEEDRQALKQALETIAELQRIESAMRRESKKAEPGRRRRKQRRKAGKDQLSFELF
jgi:hypothetical protein